MRELLRNCKKSGLPGSSARSRLKLSIFGMLMLFVIGTMAVASFTESDKNPVTTVAAAASSIMVAGVAFAVPKDLGLSDTEIKGLEALAKHFNDQFDTYAKGLMTQDTLNQTIKKGFEDFAKEYGLEKEKFAKYDEVLKQHGLQLKSMKETKGNSGPVESFKEQLKNFMSTDKFKKGIADGASQAMEIKAATTIMTTAATNAPHALSYEVIPGIQEAPRELPVVFTSLLKGSTNSRTIIWINRVNEQGNAAFTAEGALKPLKSWEYTEETSTAKKIAVRTKVSTEMLQDFDYMESEIRMLLRRDLMDELDAGILNGDGTGANLKGIIPSASGYVGTELDGTIVAPNVVDALRAAMLQMRLLNYRPDIVFMNPTDMASMDLLKTTSGHYIKIETEGILRTLQIKETTEIPAGSFLMMDSAMWIIRVLESFRLEFGWENDDFSRNLVTIIAEMRLHSYQNSIDTGSVIYETFATIEQALAIAPQP